MEDIGKVLLWILVALSFIFVSVFFVLFFAGIKKDALPDVSLVNREYVAFEDKEALRAMDRPFLIGIALHSESRGQAHFDVTYFVPKNDAEIYGIEIYPDSSNFRSAPNQLGVGENTVRIAVDFSPTSVFVRGEKTAYLNVYINMQSDEVNSVTGEVILKNVYQRKVIFPKHWRKPKRSMGTLNNTQFHWKQ